MDARLLSPVDGDASPAHDHQKQAQTDRPTGKGTFFSSVFTLLTAAMGTGLLTLPYSVLCVGIVPGVALIVGFGAVMVLTMYTYVKTAHNDGSTSLAMLAGTNLGKVVRRSMEIIMMVYCLFSCVGCFIVVADITKEPVSYFICNGTPCVWTERYVLQSVAGVFMLPPLFLREITSLRFSAVLGIVSILFIAVVIVVRGAGKFQANWADAWAKNSNNLNHWGALYGIPNICLSFQCQIQTIEVYSELRPEIRSVKLMMAAVCAAVMLEVVVYSCAAVFGYVTFLGETPTNILSASYGGNDILVEVARLCVMLVMIVQFPVNHFPARSSVFALYRLATRRCRKQGEGDTDGTGGDDGGRSSAPPTPHEVACTADQADDIDGLSQSDADLDDGAADGQLYQVDSMYDYEQDKRSARPALRRMFSPALTEPASDVPASTVMNEKAALIPFGFIAVESVVWWLLCLGLGIVIPDLTILFDILGFTLAMIIIFYVPAIVLCKNTRRSGSGSRGGRNTAVYRVLVVLFWAVGIATTLISAFNFGANVFAHMNETAGEPGGGGANASRVSAVLGPVYGWVPLFAL